MNPPHATFLEPFFAAIKPANILIFRALQLGDMLCAIPAMRALRKALPEARITLCGLPWAYEFAERFAQYFDDFIQFPGYPGLPERPFKSEELPGFLRKIQDHHYDLVVQMHGSGIITNPLTASFAGKHHAGFMLPGQFCPEPAGFIPYPQEDPEIWRLLRLMDFLGAPMQGEELAFPLTSSDSDELQKHLCGEKLEGRKYVCLHPGARAAKRRWLPQYFAKVGDALATRGWHIVLTGLSEERDLAASVAKCMHAPSLNLATSMPLGAAAALLNGSDLVICNDTGISHLASALAKPSIVIFQGSDREGWAPLNRIRHRVVSRFRGVSPEDVIAEALDLLLVDFGGLQESQLPHVNLPP